MSNFTIEAFDAEEDEAARRAEFPNLPPEPYNWEGTCLSCGATGRVDVHNICRACHEE